MNDAALMLAEVDQLERIRREPVWFAEEALNLIGDKYYLDIWQKESLDAVADVYRHSVGIPTKYNHEAKNMFTIRAMHGPGKTFWVATVMHWFNASFKGRIICTAPKEKQLATRLWPAFRKITVHAGKEYGAPIKIDSTKIVWFGDEDWCAIAETASQPENLAGYHDDYMLIVVDEASGVSEDMFPVIEGMMSTGIIVILILIGNPTKNQGTFFGSHNTPKVAKNYYQVHVDLDKTTRVSKAYVQKMVDKYGKDSPVVKIRCYGEFAEDSEAQLIPYGWVMDALVRESRMDGSIKHKRVTVDVADGGVDFTEITGADMYETGIDILKQKEYNFPTAESPVLAADAAERMFNEIGGLTINGDDIVVDSLGVGSGTAGILLKRGYNVVVYKGGEGSDDIKQWRNRRTQSYICLRDAYREGQIMFVEEFTAADELDDFTAQMCSVRGKPGSERLEELETKEAMKKRNLKSPDKADGIAMMFATQAPTITSQMDVVGCGEMASAESWD